MVFLLWNLVKQCKLALKKSHNLPHNSPILSHNLPWKYRTISDFLSHPIRWSVKEISEAISVGIEGKMFSKRQRHNVLVFIYWLGVLKFKILKYLFVCYLNIFLGNFPWFSVHKSLKIVEKYIANFFKGYINYLRTNQTGSQVHNWFSPVRTLPICEFIRETNV